MNPVDVRAEFANDITRQAALKALELFQQRDSLEIEQKGLQDWVSNADRSVEMQLREALSSQFPDDAIVGEEHENTTGSSGYIWIIDPIDGTTNFVTGTPGWCVVLACVYQDQCVCSAICDPVSGEFFNAQRGLGAFVNGRKMLASSATRLNQGTLGVGHSTRVPAKATLNVLQALMEQEGLFRRSGSGALDLAYVAAGRLIGFVEPHMNAWDCVAALLMIEEARGVVQPFDMNSMIQSGGRVVASCEGVYSLIQPMATQAYE